VVAAVGEENEKSAFRRFFSDSELLDSVVPLDGIELSTFALRMRCSTN
jgi:hypothetical protein